MVTDRAPDADRWGIAAFTGRRPHLADAMRSQDGLYTLLTRAAEGDGFELISSIATAHAAPDHGAWLAHLSAPEVVVVTVTVTEAGYLRGEDGGLDLDDVGVRADLAALRGDPRAPVRTVPGRLVAGLLARRSAGAGAITVVPCDNLPDNGAAARRVVCDLADLVDPGLTRWIEATVGWVTTMVDRITPATTEADRETVRCATGLADAAPVVTEPFTKWVLSDEFAAGRPRWEEVGARMVADVTPFEQRKRWLLNGAHSLLAYAGGIRGHATVADAVADDTCRTWVEQWWQASALQPS